jgi:hypothetical protein
MKCSAPPAALRSILIPLNLLLATAVLIGLTFGTPPVMLIAIPMVIVTAASIVAVPLEQ